jgi:F-type H+-transporting ATPase subunit c
VCARRTAITRSLAEIKKGEAEMPLFSAFALLFTFIQAVTGSNLHIGLAAAGAAIGVGLIGTAAATAVGRNPGAATKVLVQSILAIAFAEAIVFYVLFLVK